MAPLGWAPRFKAMFNKLIGKLLGGKSLAVMCVVLSGICVFGYHQDWSLMVVLPLVSIATLMALMLMFAYGIKRGGDIAR